MRTNTSFSISGQVKALLLAAFIGFSGMVWTGSSVEPVQETYVYLCMGKYAKKYHYTKNCRGLSNCSTDLKRVTLKEARSRGRTLCGWED